jgi:KaiC/GvpD/RAD55 family RecA-like ATPase
MTALRQSTGIPKLDALLGGGLIPGTQTVVLGATGIGKTQLGLQYLHAGIKQEGEPGILFDMTTRGDSQNHSGYAERLFDWKMRPADPESKPDLNQVFDREVIRKDILHLFRRSGKRVTINDLEQNEWREWKAELMKKIDRSIAFFYGNFAQGVRRCVLDGIEPTEKASDSFQFHVIEYVYHQILRKEADWVARDLFRAHFREHQAEIEAKMYDYQQVGCMILCTSREIMLDDLLTRPIESGDVLSNANTIILMGKIRLGTKMGRALYVAKHRGSACIEDIVPFEIGEQGLILS